MRSRDSGLRVDERAHVPLLARRTKRDIRLRTPNCVGIV
jgi:hypothetical protein